MNASSWTIGLKDGDTIDVEHVQITFRFVPEPGAMAKSNSSTPTDTVIGKPSMRMSEPIQVWCTANGHNVDDGRFFFDDPLGLARIADQTAAELGMDGRHGPYTISM